MGPAPVERSLSTLADYRERALELIPAQSVASVIGAPGSDVLETDERNREGWSRLALVPHVLVDVRDRGTATTVLGQAVSSPVLLSPVGSHNRAHPEGERATARAAERAGTVMGLSTVSSYTIEEVAASSQAALWFQLYVFRERSISTVLAKRAFDAGYKAIVLTVDNPGTRSDERVFRPQRQQAEHEVFPNLRGVPGAEHIGTLQFHESLDDSLSWADLEWVRSLTPLPLVVKGVQRADDARRCVECGVDALVVSNHGGHALSGTRSTAATLGEVTEGVRGEVEVFVDGGIRRGTDVLKALALGARAVLIGKPLYWGLAVGGTEGVCSVLGILQAELSAAMSLSGVSDVQAVPADLVWPRDTASLR